VTEIYIERDDNGDIVGIYSSNMNTRVTMVSKGDPILEDMCGNEFMYPPFEYNHRELAADGS